MPTVDSNEPLIGFNEASLIFMDSTFYAMPSGPYVRHGVMRMNDLGGGLTSCRSLEPSEQSLETATCSAAVDSTEYSKNRYGYAGHKEHKTSAIPSWECSCGVTAMKKSSFAGSSFNKNKVYIRSLLFGKILEKPKGYIAESAMVNALMVSKECSVCKDNADYYSYERPDMRVNPVIQVTPVCEEHKVKSNAKINLTFDQLNDAIGVTVLTTSGEAK